MMKPILPTAIALCVVAPPAVAFEPLTFGDLKLTPEIGANLTLVRDGDTVDSETGYLDLTLLWQREIGGLTFGVELFSEVAIDLQGDPKVDLVRPHIDPGLWIEGERFGYLAWSYTSSAIGEHCVEAPTAGDNFAQGDYVTVGTCPAFDTRSNLFYRTPDLGNGVKVAVSYMPQTGIESVEAGEAAESASVALILDRTDATGAQWTGSLGAERVFRVEGGGPEATAFQAGLNWAKDGWTLGGSVAVTDNGDRTQDRGLALGVSRDVSDKFTASLGINHSQSRADGARLDETSVALIGMYSFVPDKVILDGGIWHIRSDDAGVTDVRTVVGLGLSLYF
jgi:hypothetical protein